MRNLAAKVCHTPPIQRLRPIMIICDIQEIHKVLHASKNITFSVEKAQSWLPAAPPMTSAYLQSFFRFRNYLCAPLQQRGRTTDIRFTTIFLCWAAWINIYWPLRWLRYGFKKSPQTVSTAVSIGLQPNFLPHNFPFIILWFSAINHSNTKLP